MDTLQQIRDALELEFPGPLTQQVNGQTVELSEAEKAAQLDVWAQGRYDSQFPPVPASISQRQMRRWLLLQPHSIDPTKTMLDEVNAFINAPTDAIERRQQLIDWEQATVIDRANPLVSGIGAMLGLDSDALDQAFREASLIA